MDEKILYYIWLSCALYPGSKTPKLLFEHFGNISAIYRATREDYEAVSVSKADLPALCNKDLELAKRHYEYCKVNNIGFLCFEDSYYPERLRIIDNPPPLFYFKGRLKLLDDFPCIAMVGTRSCSERGFRLAYNIGFDAASKGAVIVNGLALGIDGACIAGALDAGGYAVGLLGCGIDRIYPYGNKDLFERLSLNGLILTEFAPFTKPDAKNFPVRNRVISALSIATAVFESAEGSGALITAKHALAQGRRIFAVPGKPYDKNYACPIELLKDGATLFTEADDILMEYAMSFPHRINLANNVLPNEDKLNLLVSRYFKKDSDPDAPVNRRNAPPSNNKNTFIKEKQQINDELKQRESKIRESFINSDKEASTADTVKQQDAVKEENKKPKDTSLLTPTELKIYNAIRNSDGCTPDQIVETGVKIDDVLSAITLLEIYELIEAIPGGKYRANM